VAILLIIYSEKNSRFNAQKGVLILTNDVGFVYWQVPGGLKKFKYLNFAVRTVRGGTINIEQKKSGNVMMTDTILAGGIKSRMALGIELVGKAKETLVPLRGSVNDPLYRS